MRGDVMARNATWYVFVRFWMGFSPSFPYKQFQHLRDDEIGPALDRFAERWHAKNRRKVQAAERKERERTGAAAAECAKQFIAKPAGSSAKAVQLIPGATFDDPVKGEDAPLFVRIAGLAGWEASYPGLANHKRYGPPRRVPVARVEGEDKATVLTDALQRYFKDQAHAAGEASSQPRDGESPEQRQIRLDREYLLQILNPVFTAIPESDLTPAEQLVASADLNRIREPVLGTESRAAGFTRAIGVVDAVDKLWTSIEATPSEVAADKNDLAVLRELAKATPQLVNNYELETRTRLTRKTIGVIVARLIDAGLADCPNGPRKGKTVTQRGIEFLQRVKPDGAQMTR